MIFSKNKSMVCYHPQPDAALRLVCFPCAGAGASMYRRWGMLLPNIEVWSVNYPGRESLHAMPLADSMTDIVSLLMSDATFWSDRKLVLYGHSFGALVSFWTGLRLQQDGLPVQGLLVSARRAPHLASVESYQGLSDNQLVARLDRFGGIPAAIRHDADMMGFYLPVIKADLLVNDAAQTQPDDVIDAPVYLYSGTGDDVASAEELVAWQRCTRRGFTHRQFNGGHFFIQEQQDAFVAAIRTAISALSSEDEEELIAF
ncbi:MAG: alpha/beta fold hydrolase [Gammaproteobacteria bacterium]